MFRVQGQVLELEYSTGVTREGAQNDEKRNHHHQREALNNCKTNRSRTAVSFSPNKPKVSSFKVILEPQALQESARESKSQQRRPWPCCSAARLQASVASEQVLVGRF